MLEQLLEHRSLFVLVAKLHGKGVLGKEASFPVDDAGDDGSLHHDVARRQVVVSEDKLGRRLVARLWWLKARFNSQRVKAPCRDGPDTAFSSSKRPQYVRWTIVARGLAVDASNAWKMKASRDASVSAALDACLVGIGEAFPGHVERHAPRSICHEDATYGLGWIYGDNVVAATDACPRGPAVEWWRRLRLRRYEVLRTLLRSPGASLVSLAGSHCCDCV